MNIMKEIPAGKCGAKRCPSPAAVTVMGECWDMDGVRVPLCTRHGEEANKEFSLHEVEGGVVPLTPKASPGQVIEAVTGVLHALVEPEAEAQPAAAVVEPAPATEIAVPEQELAAETADAKSALEYAKEMVIETQEDLDDANQDLREVKGRAKKLKARLDEITKPLNAALKSTRDLFRPAMDYYAACEVEFKQRIAEHVEAQEERNRAAMLEASAGNHEALAAVTHIGEVEGLSTRSTWDFIVEDEALVPREFLTVDEKKLGAYARAAKDGAPAAVPGVRFVPKTIVVSRSA